MNDVLLELEDVLVDLGNVLFKYIEKVSTLGKYILMFFPVWRCGRALHISPTPVFDTLKLIVAMFESMHLDSY